LLKQKKSMRSTLSSLRLKKKSKKNKPLKMHSNRKLSKGISKLKRERKKC